MRKSIFGGSGNASSYKYTCWLSSNKRWGTWLEQHCDEFELGKMQCARRKSIHENVAVSEIVQRDENLEKESQQNNRQAQKRCMRGAVDTGNIPPSDNSAHTSQRQTQGVTVQELFLSAQHRDAASRLLS